MKAFKRYLSIYENIDIPWLFIILSVALYMLLSNLEVKVVTLTAAIIDASQKAIKIDELAKYIISALLIGIVTVVYTYINGLTKEKIRIGVRGRLWEKLMKLPKEYYDNDDSNGLVTRITIDVDATSYYFDLAIVVIGTLYGTFVTFSELFKYNKELSTWILLIIPCSIVVTAIYSFFMYRSGEMNKRALSNTMSYLSEHVRNFRLIKAFGMEEKEYDNGKLRFKNQFHAEMYAIFTDAVQSIGVGIVMCVSIIIVFYFGGKMVEDGTLTVGQLIAFYTLSSLVAARVTQIYVFVGRFSENNGALEKISKILECEDEKQDGYELDIEDNNLYIENLSFAYRDSFVLKNINVMIPVGKVTAIIGTNGSGKSTLLKLLERLYEPTSGRILFGTTNINEFGLSSWRKSFAMVAQDKPLISGTVKENILYGLEREVSNEELIMAAKQANAYEFIMNTPNGFDAQVGPGGSNFSGGQQQCIAIARAIMRNPDYLLLDEATSNLDVKSECEVSAALEQLMKGRTTIMIAHSYASTRCADHIIIMKDGTVEASGTPEELIQTNEYYQQFVNDNKGDNND